jgi:RNA polymerase sigma-70 factor, ECF subfamily
MTELSPDDCSFAALYARAQARWPELGVTAEEVASFVGTPVEASGLGATPPAPVEDVFLAIACGRGDRRAITICEELFGEDVRRSIAAVNSAGAFVQDAVQSFREKMFFPPPGTPPRIVQYAGRGPLGAWLRMSATRLAIDLHRRARGHVALELSLDELPLEALPVVDMELQAIKTQYRQAFKDAFQAAFKRLDPRERTVLRLNTLDGLSIDEIGAVYRIHRSSAARWLSTARAKLLEETRRHLLEVVKLSAGEADLVFGVVESQLDVSLARMLKSGARADGEES